MQSLCCLGCHVVLRAALARTVWISGCGRILEAVIADVAGFSMVHELARHRLHSNLDQRIAVAIETFALLDALSEGRTR
jgi:hypothetical protein